MRGASVVRGACACGIALDDEAAVAELDCWENRSRFRALSERRVGSIPIEERRRRPSPPFTPGTDGAKVDVVLAVDGLTGVPEEEERIPKFEAACVRSKRDLGKRAVGATLSLMRPVIFILGLRKVPGEVDVEEGGLLPRPPRLLGPRTPIPIVLPLFVPISIVPEFFVLPTFYLATSNTNAECTVVVSLQYFNTYSYRYKLSNIQSPKLR